MTPQKSTFNALWNALAMVRTRSGDRQGACEAWTESLRIAPGQEGVRQEAKRQGCPGPED